MNILIQGPPRVGKTTAIEKIAKLLENVAGFYTEEIKEGEGRAGFKVRDFEGGEGILAHKKYKSPYRVGKYGVNIKSFESIAIPALKSGLERKKILLVDEIGKMEMFSDKFRKQITKALEVPNPVIATIPQKMTTQIRQMLKDKSYHLIRITKENRNKLPHLILNLLKEKNKN